MFIFADRLEVGKRAEAGEGKGVYLFVLFDEFWIFGGDTHM